MLRRLAMTALALRPVPRGGVNFLSQAYHRDPEATWRTARARGVLRYRTVTGVDTVLVTQYEDAVRVLSDPRFSLDPRLDRVDALSRVRRRPAPIGLALDGITLFHPGRRS